MKKGLTRVHYKRRKTMKPIVTKHPNGRRIHTRDNNLGLVRLVEQMNKVVSEVGNQRLPDQDFRELDKLRDILEQQFLEK
jgi:hypothetical protein